MQFEVCILHDQAVQAMEKVSTMVDSIVVVGVLTYCVMFCFLWDLKATRINV